MARHLAIAALLLAFLASAACQRQYRVVNKHDIPGNDIPSNGKSFTRVCIPNGGNYKGKTAFSAWQAYCDDTPGCVAAVAPVEPSDCAYLKAKGTRDVVKPDPKWVVMTTQEKPSSGCAKFAANGEQCTSDPWADQQICCGGNHVKCLNGACISTFPSGPREWRSVGGHDISGYDIPASDGKAFTKWCTPAGGLMGKYGTDAFKLACDTTPGCVAFTVSNVGAPDGCAYLKTKGTRGVIKANPNFTTFTSQEKPQQPCTFSPQGGQCTTDAWVDKPVCCGGNHVKCNNGVCGSTFPSGRKLAM